MFIEKNQSIGKLGLSCSRRTFSSTWLVRFFEQLISQNGLNEKFMCKESQYKN